MYNMRNLVLIFIALFALSCTGSNTECKRGVITDSRDLPENIPGETMGQKLESLLFWNQEEKERRFSKMHIIYPSIAVPVGNSSKLETGDKIEPKWEGNNIGAYMEENRVGGLIAIHNNKVVLEEYADGFDENTLWTSYSVAKSVSSMLVGIALKNGDIGGMDDKLEKYIPEFVGKDYGQVTVEQLLTMTSGIDWNEDYVDPNSDVAQMYQKPCEGDEAHILTYMKDMKLAHSPGEVWNYSTGETDLVGILVQKASGKSLGEYLSENIWKPYGMNSCAYWLADECSNLNIGGSGLSASLRDYAKLGLLMLDDGKINGESIFADSWLENATKSLYSTDEAEGGYGYLWWRNADGSYLAQGIFGQMLYINPEKNLVISQYAAWPLAGSEELSQKRIEMINAVIAEI